jgi:hypothetical protein
MRAICPVASFTPMTFGSAKMRFMVATEMSTTLRGGML